MLAIVFGIYVLFVRLPKKSEMVGQIDGKVSRRADGMGGMVSRWRFVMLYVNPLDDAAIARIRIHDKKSVTDRLPDLQFCTIPMYVSQKICAATRTVTVMAGSLLLASGIRHNKQRIERPEMRLFKLIHECSFRSDPKRWHYLLSNRYSR